MKALSILGLATTEHLYIVPFPFLLNPQIVGKNKPNKHDST